MAGEAHQLIGHKNQVATVANILAVVAVAALIITELIKAEMAVVVLL